MKKAPLGRYGDIFLTSRIIVQIVSHPKRTWSCVKRAARSWAEYLIQGIPEQPVLRSPCDSSSRLVEAFQRHLPRTNPDEFCVKGSLPSEFVPGIVSNIIIGPDFQGASVGCSSPPPSPPFCSSPFKRHITLQVPATLSGLTGSQHALPDPPFSNFALIRGQTARNIGVFSGNRSIHQKKEMTTLEQCSSFGTRVLPELKPS